MKDRPSPLGLTGTALVWAVGFFWMSRIVLALGLADPDLWWHLAAGRTMVEQRIFLRSDIFSHTFYGTSWINFEWLSQIILYGVEKFSGMKGLYYFKFVLVFVVMGLVIRALYKAGARGPILLGLALFGFSMLRIRLFLRPELITFIFMAGFSIGIVSILKEEISLRSKIPWIFFGMMVLWVNLHAGFIYGLGFLFLMDLGLRWVQAPAQQIRMVDRSVLLCLVAICLNPYGLKILTIFYEHLFQVFKGPKGAIVEWGESSIELNRFFWVIYGSTLIALAYGLLKKILWVKIWTPAVFIFAIWGSLSIRNTALFLFIALPFLGGLSGILLNKNQYYSYRFIWMVAWIAAIFPMIANAHSFFRKPPDQLVDPRYLPVRACEFIQTHSVPGPIYNTYHYGGYISWKAGPKRKVFWDGRYLFYPLIAEILDLSKAVRENHPHASTDYFDKKQITAALVEPQRIPLFPRADWALVFWDDAAFVYLRRCAVNQALIDQYEYSVCFPEDPEIMREVLIQHPELKQRFQKECERQRAEVGFTFLELQMEKLLP